MTENMAHQPADRPVWQDGDPLMEAIAAAVYEHCEVHPGSGLVIDDPRNIAAAAVAGIRDADRQTAKYPHTDGDTTILGPEVFASIDGQVISWRGMNYVPQPEFANRQADEQPAPDRIPLDDLTSDTLDQLYAELDRLRARVQDWRTSTAAGIRLVDELRAERDALAAGVPLVCSDERHKTKVFALETEIKRLRDKHEADLRHADQVNNELMLEVQQYADGAAWPVPWSVYNQMHNRALAAEARLAALRCNCCGVNACPSVVSE